MQEWPQKEIEKLIQERKSGLLYFYTPLCGTCQVASKMLEVIEALMPDLLIGKADLNYMPTFGEQLEIESVPCLIIINEGKLEDKTYAFHSVPYLLDKITSVH
ncbi:thioredoxin family protein [Cytobacillus depressus]|uniref:Thioredoxin family protein n=1 Tax=Cytobacillus depressus TaxID=1602942 RepID=A0A6L3V5T3_9BACI|nr:thioredoxin family protein [Cytobacillus depressus]KAB2334769.1 thioredoxin family protein [Cytobacillus depressus]